MRNERAVEMADYSFEYYLFEIRQSAYQSSWKIIHIAESDSTQVGKFIIVAELPEHAYVGNHDLFCIRGKYEAVGKKRLAVAYRFFEISRGFYDYVFWKSWSYT